MDCNLKVQQLDCLSDQVITYIILKILKNFGGGGLEQKFDTNEKWPIGILYSQENTVDPVTIHFQHYESFEQASKAWKRREKRLNLEHLVVIYMHTPYTTQDDLKRFANLSFKRKIIIYDATLLSNLQLEGVILVPSKAFTWKPDFSWDFALMNKEVKLKDYLK